MPIDLPTASVPPHPDTFWRKVRRVVGHVPFLDELLAAWYCAFDPRTPPAVKAILFGALGYFVLPADLVPDLFATIGFTDDAAVLAAALAAVGRYVQPEHRDRAQRQLDSWKRA